MEIIIGPSSQVMCGSNKIIELKRLEACQAYSKHLISEVIVREVIVCAKYKAEKLTWFIYLVQLLLVQSYSTGVDCFPQKTSDDV